jgi:hypothetical protein
MIDILNALSIWFRETFALCLENGRFPLQTSQPHVEIRYSKLTKG